jgi:hypothetical protein
VGATNSRIGIGAKDSVDHGTPASGYRQSERGPAPWRSHSTLLSRVEERSRAPLVARC